MEYTEDHVIAAADLMYYRGKKYSQHTTLIILLREHEQVAAAGLACRDGQHNSC